RIAPRRPLVAEWLLMLAWTAQLVLLALHAPVPVLVVASTIGGVGLTLANTLWFTVLQTFVPEHAISRVSSYDDLGSFIVNPLSLVLAGPAAAHLGITTTITVCAIGSAGSVAFALATPAVRTLRLPEKNPMTRTVS